MIRLRAAECTMEPVVFNGITIIRWLYLRWLLCACLMFLCDFPNETITICGASFSCNPLLWTGERPQGDDHARHCHNGMAHQNLRLARPEASAE